MSNTESTITDRPDRLSELVAGQVLGDLTENEAVELESLVGGNESVYKTLRRELDTVLSRTQIAFENEFEGVPDQLRGQVLRDAKIFFQGKNTRESHAARLLDSAFITRDPNTPNQAGPFEDAPDDQGKDKWASDEKEGPHSNLRSTSENLDGAQAGARFGLREGIAWICCAAAIVIAVGLWGNYSADPRSSVSFAKARAELIADSASLIKADWGDGKHPFKQNVSGDVVWDNESQTGFMRFAGMPQNDPARQQYQLWIIDPDRDDEPIDGGVFDIDSTGEVIVPIHAKLEVLNPAAFAITVEKPGGVVVSTQENLPLLASVN